jgi:threonine/homoserine/homoserine lactone efflux protein
MNWQEYVSLLAFCAAMSFSPGPNTMLATALAANHGWRRALKFCFAVPAGWTVLMLACGLGVGALVVQWPAINWAIKLLGAIYMLWLASKLAGTRQMAQAGAAKLDVNFWQGAALQFVNIKAWLLALTLTAGWITPGSNQPLRLLIVCAIMLCFAFCSNFSYALMGSMLRQWLSIGQRLLWFNRCMAAVLAATTLWMLTL